MEVMIATLFMVRSRDIQASSSRTTAYLVLVPPNKLSLGTSRTVTCLVPAVLRNHRTGRRKVCSIATESSNAKRSRAKVCPLRMLLNHHNGNETMIL